jgi:thiamine biosynthesis lipoprotein
MRTRRARPLLGTLVDIRVDHSGVDGVDEARALAAIDAAFAEIAEVHRLMSFHEATSDVARINREASRAPVAIDPRTREVIALALAFARESNGRFDPTIAAELVAWNLLPRPSDAPAPAIDADWRDIELCEDGRIRATKPLWIDLGGIAKGYAVDRAIDRLRAFGIDDACVNAGGDLRRIGSGTEPIHIRMPAAPHPPVRTLLLGEGSIASSGSYFQGAHVDAMTRTSMRERCVSVVADRCVVADALTKIVMSDADIAAPLLETWNAEALVFDGDGARLLGRAA